MSGKIQHDPNAFMLALASAHAGWRVSSMNVDEKERWRRVAACAVEHLARDAAASAAQGASAVAQNAAILVLTRVSEILTPEQRAKMTEIVVEMTEERKRAVRDE